MRRTVMVVALIAFLASACEFVPVAVGETESRSCPGGGEATAVQVDHHSVNLLCDSEVVAWFNCPDGLVLPSEPDPATVAVECGPIGQEPPVDEALPELMAEPLDSGGAQAAAVYCSGGQGWQGRGSWSDRMGPLPDAPGDDMNWRISFILTWCVKNGAVQCGLSFVDTVYEYRFYEINDEQSAFPPSPGGTGTITPCGTSRRDASMDWDMRIGYCPYCVTTDVDLNFYVKANGVYGGTWRNSGDGW